MDSRKTVAAYSTLEKRVGSVLIEHDPSGLYALGAPHDEHDGDVHAIISALQHATSVADVRPILESTLGSWIRDAGKDVDVLCATMAPPIWEAWRDFKSEVG